MIEVVRALAEKQWGPVARRQFLDLGMSGNTVDRWLGSGRLCVVHPGVYTLGHRLLAPEGRLVAALLYAGPGSVLSYLAAAWWLGIIDGALGLIQISTPNHPRSLDTVAVHRPRSIESIRHRRLPITTVPRILIDSANLVSDRMLRQLLSEVVYQRFSTLDEIEAALGPGLRGSTKLRRALDRHRPELARTVSDLEIAFVELCGRAPFSMPEVNVRVEGFKVDALWRQERVVVELDSQKAHGTSIAVAADCHRDLTLRAAGYIVRRYSWIQVTQTPELVIADLIAAYAERPRQITPGNRG